MHILHNEGDGIKVGSFVLIGAPALPLRILGSHACSLRLSSGV